MVSLQHAFIHWTLWQRDTLEIGIFLVVGCVFTHQFDLTILLLYSTWWEFMPLMAFWWNAEIRWMEKLVTARHNSYTLNETPLWIERSCLNSVAEFHLTIDHSLLYPTPANQPTKQPTIPYRFQLKNSYFISIFSVYISRSQLRLAIHSARRLVFCDCHNSIVHSKWAISNALVWNLSEKFNYEHISVSHLFAPIHKKCLIQLKSTRKRHTVVLA